MAATALSILLLSVALLVRAHGEHADTGLHESLPSRSFARDDDLISNSDFWEFRRDGITVAEKKDARRSGHGEEQMLDTMLDAHTGNVGLQEAVKYQPQPKNGLASVAWTTTPQPVRTRAQVTFLLRSCCCVFKRIDSLFLSGLQRQQRSNSRIPFFYLKKRLFLPKPL
jgi:hypothetical protein